MSKKISETVNIVYEADATRYEILVTLVKYDQDTNRLFFDN